MSVYLLRPDADEQRLDLGCLGGESPTKGDGIPRPFQQAMGLSGVSFDLIRLLLGKEAMLAAQSSPVSGIVQDVTPAQRRELVPGKTRERRGQHLVNARGILGRPASHEQPQRRGIGLPAAVA